MNKLYAKFLEEAAKDTDKSTVIKKFDRIFKNVRFDQEEKRFNQEFLEGFFRRKKIA